MQKNSIRQKTCERKMMSTISPKSPKHELSQLLKLTNTKKLEKNKLESSKNEEIFKNYIKTPKNFEKRSKFKNLKSSIQKLSPFPTYDPKSSNSESNTIQAKYEALIRSLSSHYSLKKPKFLKSKKKVTKLFNSIKSIGIKKDNEEIK